MVKKMLSWLPLVAFLTMTATRCTAGRASYDPFQRIEAEDYSYAKLANPQTNCNVSYVGYIVPGASIAYYGVDFSTGAQRVQMRVAAFRDHGTINLHLDDPTAAPFASVAIQVVDAEDFCHFFPVMDFVITVPKGMHDLYFTFDCPTDQPFVNLDWFYFRVTNDD